MNITRRTLTASAVASAFFLAACGGGSSSGSGGGTQFEREGDRAIGSSNAPVTVIEYASTSCPHCAEFHEDVFPTIEERYIETGQVRFVFREMLTGAPSLAQAGFMLARCAPDDRYFDVIDLLFEQQQAIFQAAQSPNGTRSEFWNIAQTVGLSRDEFNACITDAELRRDVADAHEQAIADGIDGTPRFIINGHVLDADRNGSQLVYYWNEAPLRINDELVPATVDEATFIRILDHFVAQSGAEVGAEESESE
ncbi:DsbA family protein [Hyphobacterium sp.]|uniref:DsbA family protein n=1 Tax=Hyphobacterium sp. TaxID=2004662 RepID=UPI003B51A618